jgi:hypothetical protein
MKKDWEEKAEKSVKKYNKEILEILQETGYSGVIPLIKGLQKKIKTMEGLLKARRNNGNI